MYALTKYFNVEIKITLILEKMHFKTRKEIINLKVNYNSFIRKYEKRKIYVHLFQIK